jgi:phage/plasmid primase-like uncharacterized protein
MSAKVTRRGHNKRYRAVQFSGGYAIGDWSTDLKDYAFEEGFDYNKCKRQIEEARRKLTKERSEGQQKASLTAKQIWDAAANCTSHPYLESKKIKAHGLKIERQTLLIPLYDEQGNLTSLQKIWPANGKFIKGFLKGSRIQGCCFTVGDIQDTVVICEGYATGAAIFEITGLPVVVAFSSNNLQCVAKIVSKKYPNAKITVAADNDRFKAGNPGLTKAKEAAAAVKARLVVPEFASDEGESTDFNDLYIFEGKEKVKNAFLSILSNKCNRQYTEETQKDDTNIIRVRSPDTEKTPVRCIDEKKPNCPMRPKISITNQWPDSIKELKRLSDRDSKTVTAFSRSENDPRYQLSHPVDEYELEYFLKNLNESNGKIEDAFDNLAYEVRQLRKTLEDDNAK